MSGLRLCHQGHSNPLSSRYCHQCGASLTDGQDLIERIVGDRYRILRDIGHGGFGQTYLAEDSNRFNERCVLKELAPAAENQDSLDKAKELFAREAEVLYKLQHPQIPRFREWFIEPTRESMFLVQDYVEGPTYQEILRDRQSQTFSESEVVTLMTQLLPVLSYIHGRGVIHRDLSPDNLICRNSDRLPVLIDFGGVKEVTVSAARMAQRNQDEPKNNVTLIGKPGYSPEEQMRRGQVSAASDLYALGVTALVLLTGTDPSDFYDAFNLKFDWRSKVKVGAGLAAILDKMVAHQVAERYTSAAQVLQDLEHLSQAQPVQQDWTVAPQPDWTDLSHPSGAAQTMGSSKTLVVAPLGTVIAEGGMIAAPHPAGAVPQVIQGGVGLLWNGMMGLVRSLLVLMLLVGAGALGWVAVRALIQSQQTPRSETGPTAQPTQSYSSAERQRKNQLISRLDGSGVPSGFFYRLANEAYYLQYPDQRGQLLSNGPEDEQRRSNWDQTAVQVLAFTEQLSPSARSRLGSYSQSDRDQWNRQLRAAQKKPRSFYEGLEAQLKRSLGMYREVDLKNNNTVANQLLDGMAADQIQRL